MGRPKPPFIPPVIRNQRPAALPPVRPERKAPIPTLTGLAAFWVLMGRGNTGKTLFARYLASVLIERAVNDFAIAALDPGNRVLAEFIDVYQPAGTGEREIARFLGEFLGQVMESRMPVVADFGASNTAWENRLRAQPNLPRTMEDAGVGLIGAYFFGASPDDPVVLEQHAEAGFMPRATLLVLNERNVGSADDFDAIRAHPGYKAALARGAVEIIIPELDTSIAQMIEAHRYHFFQARDGIVPEGNPNAPLELPPIERCVVSDFMAGIARELQPIEAAGWLPWV